MGRAHAIVVVAAFFALATLPLAVQVVGPAGAQPGWENRVLAPPPTRADGVSGWTRAAGAWLDDHFGLRRTLVQLNNRVRFAVFGESSNPQLAFGRGGELFFTSHTAQQPLALLDFLCAGGASPAGVDAMTAGLAAFIDDATRMNARTQYLLVPTKTVVLAERLPDWMRARCARATPVATAVLAAIGARRPDIAARIDYPYALLRGMTGAAPPYPKVNFHWDGAAPRLVAADMARRFGRPMIAPLPAVATRRRSDVQMLLPGVPLRFVAEEPDFAAAGISACDCVPGLGEPGQLIGDVSRFARREGGAPRLLILSDSFGKAIAPWFGAYYGEVWHVSLTDMQRLSPAQVAVVRRTLFETYKPDDVLYVFHDFSVAYINDLLHRSFWAQGG